jgi:hypothetical protein
MRASKEFLKGELGEAFALERCLIFPFGEGYFEGVKGLGDLSPTCVVLRFAHTTVTVEGEGLSVGKYLDGDLQLCGKIISLKAESGK